MAGGTANISSCGLGGQGYFNTTPHYSYFLSGMESYGALEIEVEASCDTTLLVNTPDTTWYFDDDSHGNLQPRLNIPASGALNGRLDLWVGTYSGNSCPANVVLATHFAAGGAPAPSPQPAPTADIPTFESQSGLPWQEIIDNAGLIELPFQEFPAPSAQWNTSVAEHFCNEEQVEECRVCASASPDNCLTLGAVAEEILASMDDAGFSNIGIYYGIGGAEEQTPVVVLITPGERILESGESATSNRFNLSNPFLPRDSSFLEYARTFFNVNEGRMRFFLVVVGGDYFFANGQPEDAFERMKDATRGGGRISAHLHEIPVMNEMPISIMVYEFETIRAQQPQLVESSEHTSRSHLEYAGISAFSHEQ